jgi:hypothetical protein
MKAMSHTPAMENSTAFVPEIDPNVAEQVGQEILQNRLDPATWATALSASGGSKQEALAAYARIRIQGVATHRKLRTDKVKSFECRRINKCFGVKTVHDLLQRAHPGRQMNFVRPRLSIVLLSILFVGSAGGIGALGRLNSIVLPDSLSLSIPLLAMLCGLVIVAAAMTLRYMLPKRWIMLGWNTALLGACTIACFASLVGGVKLIAHAAPLEAAEESTTPVAVMIAPATILKNQDLAVSAQ